jgi:hypothetical protein
LEYLEVRLAPAIDMWTGAHSQNWSDPLNWSLNTVPGASDTALFTNNSSVKNFLSTVDTPFTIGALNIDSTWGGPGGTIIVPSSLSVTNNFSMASGDFREQSNGAVTIDGSGQWSGGLIGVGGGGFLNKGTLTISGGVTGGTGEAINGPGTFTNGGTILQTGSGDLVIDGAYLTQFNNGGIYTFEADSSITGDFNGGGIFSNPGTISKTLTSGTSTIAVSFNNSGTINVQTGTVTLEDLGTGTNTGGNFVVAQNAALNLADGYANPQVTWSGNYTGSGLGTVSFSRGELYLGGATTFNFSPGLFQWSGGLLDLNGDTLTNAGTGSITLSGASGENLVGGGGLVNNGTITQTGAGNLYISNNGNVPTNLYNQLGASYSFQADSGIGTGSTGNVINGGTLSKVAGTGTSAIDTSFSNSGTLAVQSGTVSLQGASVSSTGGTFSVSTGATLDLTGGATVAYTGSYTGSGAGTVALKSGILQVGTGGATFNMAGSLFQWSGGYIDVTNGSFTNTGTINYSGSNNVVLNGAGSLINKKSIVQTSLGTLVLQNGATLNNATGATYNLKSNGGISGGTVLNTGILEKSAGTGTTTIATSTLSNTGTMAVTSGTLNISAAVSQVSGSTLTAGSWTVTGSATVHATLDITSAGSLNTIGSAAKVTLNGLNTAFSNLSGLNALLKGGSFSVLGGQFFTTAADLSNAGSVILNKGTLNVSGNLSNTGSVSLTTGTLNVTGTVAQLSGTSLTGGTWTIGPNSNLNFAGGSNITSLAGAQVTLNGANSNFAALANLASIGSTSSFSLLGSRSFTAVGSFTDNGKVTVGPGSTLTANGSFTQASTATLAIQLGGANAAPTFGQVVSTTGTVTLAGTLQVTSTVVPAVGSSFEILANQGNAAIGGTFTGLAEGGTFTVKSGSTTMTFRISYLGNGGNNVVITRIS